MSELLALGALLSIASLVMFAISIILFFMTLLSPKYKKPAMYLLLGSGIGMLLSFGLCSVGASGGGSLGL